MDDDFDDRADLVAADETIRRLREENAHLRAEIKRRIDEAATARESALHEAEQIVESTFDPGRDQYREMRHEILRRIRAQREEKP